METMNMTARNVLLLLFKDFTSTHTVTSLASAFGLSRVGMWKVLKRLERDNYITLRSVGKGKTSASTVELNWGNILVEKVVALSLTEEALAQRRWRVNFAGLENIVDFLLLYGSILHSPQEARDIDLVAVADKKSFVSIQNVIDKAQKTQTKKIHCLNFTRAEFAVELKKPNKAFVDGIKKGTVLFGHESFVQFMKGVSQ